MILLFILLLIIALFIEGSVTTLPLVLIILLCLTILKRDASIFPIAFFTGIFLDIVTLRTLGESSLFFLCMAFLILLYQRKYEITSYPFVAVSAFLGAASYLLVFGYSGWFWTSCVSSIVAILFYGGIKRTQLQFL